MSRILVLVRHGESTGNLANSFTGWRDLDLTERGRLQAQAVAQRLLIRNIPFAKVFTSNLQRTRHSAEITLEALGRKDLPIIADAALNERDYGDLTGLDKDEARRRWGNDQVQRWRRSYEHAPPGGESLRDTVARVLPYFLRHILPCVMRGDPTLVVAHGNSLRALIMALDGLTPAQISEFELQTGETLIYELADDTTVQKRDVFSVP